MGNSISKTLPDRRIRKNTSWIFSELSRGDYSNIDLFDTEDVFNILSRLKVNADFIALLFNIFRITRNEELKSKVSIGILYHSIGSRSVFLYSTKLSSVLDYVSRINSDDLDDLLAWKIKISWVTSQQQKNKIRAIIEFWRKQKFLAVKVVSAIDKQLTSPAND